MSDREGYGHMTDEQVGGRIHDLVLRIHEVTRDVEHGATWAAASAVATVAWLGYLDNRGLLSDDWMLHFNALTDKVKTAFKDYERALEDERR